MASVETFSLADVQTALTNLAGEVTATAKAVEAKVVAEAEVIDAKVKLAIQIVAQNATTTISQLRALL
jgi:hypothetical protein